MPWVLIDDAFNDHPKWATAPCDSIAMWVAAIAWCNHHERWDGRIPTVRLRGLVNAKNPNRTIADLENRKAMRRDGDDHVIHDFAEWQRVERKKAISDARRAAGRKGAANRWHPDDDGNSHHSDGKPDGNCYGKPDGLPPTTYSLVESENNSTPENTRGAGDNSERKDLILDLYAAAELAAAKAKGVNVRSEDGYKRKARGTGAAHPKLDVWLAMFPTAPATSVAAWLQGDTHSMAYCERVDPDEPLATVHHLRSETA